MNAVEDNKQFVKNAIDAAIKITLLGIMAALSYNIIQPFVMPVLWGIIIAVAIGPMVEKLINLMGGRRKLAITLFTLVAVAILVIPAYLLVRSSFEGVQSFASDLRENKIDLPPAPDKLVDVPLIGEKCSNLWNLASTDLEKAIVSSAPLAKTLSAKISGAIGGLVGTVLQFVISFVIAAFFMINPQKGFAASTKIATSLAGDRGEEFTKLTTATIRGVMNGVVGVAVIQAVLGTLGMVVLGVPLAALWGLLILIFAIAQLPPIIILGPVAIYAFGQYSTTAAVIFLIWALLVSGCDGILKPILMARGLDTPMLVVLLGAIGGMMLAGIIGLFVGAVVLSITYTLFMAWVGEKTDDESTEVPDGPSETPE